MKKCTFILCLLALLSFAFRHKTKTWSLSLQSLEKDMKFFPASSVSLADSAGANKIVSVPSFYMYQYEVSNLFYLWFLYDIRDSSLYRDMLPDTLCWRHKLVWNDPYIEYYLRHPAYRNYPVVGVSYEQCEQFCKWLSEKYNSAEGRKYKKVIFKLPSKNQWRYAASYNPKTKGLDAALYPWHGVQLRNKKGLYLANFSVAHQEAIIRADGIRDEQGRRITNVPHPYNYVHSIECGINMSADYYYEDATAPVDSYLPSPAGLYNMAGNVREYLLDKGFTKGGSWKDIGYFLRNDVEGKYENETGADSQTGFRFVMEILDK